jgi:hypothetical protein
MFDGMGVNHTRPFALVGRRDWDGGFIFLSLLVIVGE